MSTRLLTIHTHTWPLNETQLHPFNQDTITNVR